MAGAAENAGGQGASRFTIAGPRPQPRNRADRKEGARGNEGFPREAKPKPRRSRGRGERVRWRGLEPPRPNGPQGPQPCASTNSATSARTALSRAGSVPRRCATRVQLPSTPPSGQARATPMRERPSGAHSRSGRRTAASRTLSDGESEGIGVRVLVGGGWGFASDRRLSPRGSARCCAPRAAGSPPRPAAPNRGCSRRSTRAPVRTGRRSSKTPSPFRSTRRSPSASGHRGVAPPRRRQGRRGIGCAPRASESSSSPPTGSRSTRSSSSAEAACRRWAIRDGRRGSSRSYPSLHVGSCAQAGWEYVESLVLESRGAAARRGGSRAAPRGRVPPGSDDGRDRPGADAAPGPRVGRPSDRARPRLRHRGRICRHELPQARRPRLLRYGSEP